MTSERLSFFQAASIVIGMVLHFEVYDILYTIYYTSVLLGIGERSDLKHSL